MGTLTELKDELMKNPEFKDAYLQQMREMHQNVEAQEDSPPQMFDFEAHLDRQYEFSQRTYGPGFLVVGILDHIRKELNEIEKDPLDLEEWIDVIILALDGALRSGRTSREVIDALVAKQTKNEGRTWPDWRTADRTKAIEHDRSTE